jgi:hypothetical protein
VAVKVQQIQWSVIATFDSGVFTKFPIVEVPFHEQYGGHVPLAPSVLKPRSWSADLRNENFRATVAARTHHYRHWSNPVAVCVDYQIMARLTKF